MITLCVSWVNAVCLDRWLHKSRRDVFHVLVGTTDLWLRQQRHRFTSTQWEERFPCLSWDNSRAILSIISQHHMYTRKSLSCDSAHNPTASQVHKENSFICFSWDNIIMIESVASQLRERTEMNLSYVLVTATKHWLCCPMPSQDRQKAFPGLWCYSMFSEDRKGPVAC